jgi:hypothetical protein
LVGVEANYDYGTTLYAPSGDKEVKVHKEQGCGMTCGRKCEEDIVNSTDQVIHLTLVGEDNVNYAWMLQSQHHLNVIYNFHVPLH